MKAPMAKAAKIPQARAFKGRDMFVIRRGFTVRAGFDDERKPSRHLDISTMLLEAKQLQPATMYPSPASRVRQSRLNRKREPRSSLPDRWQAKADVDLIDRRPESVIRWKLSNAARISSGVEFVLKVIKSFVGGRSSPDLFQPSIEPTLWCNTVADVVAILTAILHH
ncbi:hypothetical protein JAAARDRAFT_286752 [Jaapia argillacea MUCL 33604]|uniref:Uncharacterized protein n=1 Tax=Jaapia argillacea MUCL 33604 TaxID=933084 RepID=A0A067PQU0_9AGAM|nr:hypothetical protein JAAARDRAFT_286752 [Jaapia argillacea MUCL 33604]